jgi:TonB-linked outer membrane protein, SusC/RagA family
MMTANVGYDINNANYIGRLMSPNLWRAERNRDANGDLIFTHVYGPQEMYQTTNSTGRKKEFVDIWLNYKNTIARQHNIGATAKFNADSEERTDNFGTDIKDGIARRHESLAGRLTYNYNLRYFLDFNFGYTGSENFATGHKWGFFPAYSLAWNIAEEKFIKNNLPWMNMFKIRYSYGKVGDDNIGTRFPYLYTLASNTSYRFDWGDFGFTNSYDGLYYSQIASTNVSWEEVTKRDLGVDFSLFNDKLVITADYFNEFREGIYYQRNHLPYMLGLQSAPTANIGRVHSTGTDGNFSYRQNIGKAKLTVRGNWTYSKNKILEIDEENNVYPYQMYTNHRVGQIWGFKSLGLFKDWDDIRNSPKQTFGSYMPGDIKYADVNGDGVINSLDTAPIGATSKPNLIYGLGFSLQYSGFDANIHFQGAGKSSFLINGPNVYAFSQGTWGNFFTDLAHSNRWISSDISGDPATENPNAEYPRLSYGGNANNYVGSDFWIRDGRYLRLKTIELGYTLPKTVLTKLRLNNLRVFMIGTNLFTFSKFKMWDPELGSSTGEEYPIVKTISLGLTVNI